MSKIVVFTNEYVTVECLPDKKMIYHIIHQPIGDQVEMFKQAMNAGTDALKLHGATKWLSDDRKNGPLAHELVEWGFADWNPRTIKAGWKYWANIVPEEVVSAGTLIPVIENLYQLGLRMQIFTSEALALAWLEKFD